MLSSPKGQRGVSREGGREGGYGRDGEEQLVLNPVTYAVETFNTPQTKHRNSQ